MDYSPQGAKRRTKQLRARTPKLANMFYVTFFMVFILGVIAVAAIGIAAGIGAFKGVLASAPTINEKDIRPVGYSSTVYDSEGNKVTKLVAAESNRIYQTIDKIPIDLQHAFVAIEDERFYEHNGIDLKGIVRAAYTGITTRDFSQGASTITQQLIKNNVFTGWTKESSFADKLKRKIQEQYLAIELEKQDSVTKENILELYLNTINLGQNTLGVQAASLRYFNKNVSELNLSEAAVIAGITQNPSRYNPISHPENNEERRKKVLRNMRDQGYITQAAYDEAMADDVYERIQTINAQNEESTINSYFVDALTKQVMEDLENELGYTETQAYNQLYSGGLSIYATQDPAIQKIADEVTSNEDNYPANTRYLLDYQLTVQDNDGNYMNFSTEAMQAHFKESDASYNRLYKTVSDANAGAEAYKDFVLDQGYTFVDDTISTTPQPQISMTIEDQKTGYVKAIVGGRGKKEASLTLNRATDTTRQPGSTFKVVSTYVPALDTGMKTLASVQVDEPFNYENGRPVRNWYSSGYKGPCTLRYGIEQSLNIVAVKTLTDITPKLGFEYLQKLGFTTLIEERVTSDGRVLSDITQALALGGITDGVKNLELNAAYATIANGGKYIKPKFYTKILDHDGNVLLENTVESEQVIQETTAWLLTSAMEDVVTKGTGGRVRFDGMTIAGKTGTTSDENDVWFAGYTPYYTCTTWAGFDNNVDLKSGDEANLAKTIWRETMSRIHEGKEDPGFPQPAGITKAVVCNKSGKLAVDGMCTADGSAFSEFFAEGTVPTEACDVHGYGQICALTGLMASDTCPYKVPGVVSGTGYCPHSYDALGNSLYTGGATNEAAAAAAQAQQNQIGATTTDPNAAAAAAAALAAQNAALAAQQNAALGAGAQ
ncbi:MAG: PBP1A family penicillin-binding protein [Lachnospiraceae bacterium]|nr:PBP1A family penicillin-binding protein [Lachnospiraceae bacterium]